MIRPEHGKSEWLHGNSRDYPALHILQPTEVISSLTGQSMDAGGTTQETKEKGSLTPRERYLARIGLGSIAPGSDPFRTPIAENELANSRYFSGRATEAGERRPFFEYYTQPAIPFLGSSDLIEKLDEPKSSFLYGPPGSGKSRLRLELEHYVRSALSHTLCVSFPLNTRSPQHWQDLAQAFAIDLFVQFVEHYGGNEISLSSEQACALSQQLAAGGGNLRRLVKRMVDGEPPESIYGWGTLWRSVSRPTVRSVTPSEKLRDELNRVLANNACNENDTLENTAAIWQKSLHAAQNLGFRRVFLLIDIIDRSSEESAFSVETIRHLIEQTMNQRPGSIEVFLKAFLPISFREQLTQWVNRLNIPTNLNEDIHWNKETLQKLLANRLLAAGARRRSFFDLAGEGLEGDLDDLLVRASLNSPRRYLQIIDALIDAHAARDPDDLFITNVDWETMRSEWQFEPAVPVVAA